MADHGIGFGGYSTTWDGAVANVVGQAGGCVEGVVYELAPEELGVLDRFEGHPRVYVRERRTVAVDGHGDLEVFVYVRPGCVPNGRVSPEYLEVLRLQYLRLGFDEGPLATAANAWVETGDDLRSDEVLVFVYGSLMLGEQHHDLLGRSRWVGPARTEPRYTLRDLGDYPAILEGGAGVVVGELYAVDAATLEALDQFEESPEVYERVPLMLERGGVAQGYVGRSTGGGRPVPGGNWRVHRAARAANARTR